MSGTKLFMQGICMRKGVMVLLLSAVIYPGLISDASAAQITDRFFFGSYAGVFYDDPAPGITYEWANTALYYHQGYLTDAKVLSRLNSAQSNGMRIIMDIPGVTIGSDGHTITNYDTGRISQFVNTFKDHPALAGWYIADEPINNATQIGYCENIYNTVKNADPSHPVMLALDSANKIVPFVDAYDKFIYVSYPYWQGQSDCQAIPAFQSSIGDALPQIAIAGKPWILANQGFGRSIDPWRLPTLREHRFSAYFAYAKGAEGVLDWEWNSMHNSPANAGDAYPYDGETWKTYVYGLGLSCELAHMNRAMNEGAHYTVSDNNADVFSYVFDDPVNGKTYLMALNNTNWSGNVTFTINKPGTWIAADSFEYGGPPNITISNNQFGYYFDGYEVATFELLHIPEPSTIALLLSGSIVTCLMTRCRYRKAQKL